MDAQLPDGPLERVEYALQHVCAIAGCDPPHGDDGVIVGVTRNRDNLGTTINGNHAIVITRTVTVGEWKRCV